ncbi:MAG: hypothetical protein JSR37_01055 [Verrucomicrobia bacterium]|nr:hypothetical protein [Verrucomicrobiota bacterium]MBS0636759.1 hypothetical protein [Verrucomicrobiota bacterium]
MKYEWYEINSTYPCPRNVSNALFCCLDAPQSNYVESRIVELMRRHEVHHLSCNSAGYYRSYDVVKLESRIQIRVCQTAQEGFRVIAEFWRNPLRALGRLFRIQNVPKCNSK